MDLFIWILTVWPNLTDGKIEDEANQWSNSNDSVMGSLRVTGGHQALITGFVSILNMGFSIVMEVPQARWMVYFMEAYKHGWFRVPYFGKPSYPGWWFGTCFFPYIGNNHPNWLIFFRGVQTTNQYQSHTNWVTEPKAVAPISSSFCLTRNLPWMGIYRSGWAILSMEIPEVGLVV